MARVAVSDRPALAGIGAAIFRIMLEQGGATRLPRHNQGNDHKKKPAPRNSTSAGPQNFQIRCLPISPPRRRASRRIEVALRPPIDVV